MPPSARRASILGDVVVSAPPARSLRTVTTLVGVVHASLSRGGISAGPVVATLAIITLVAVVAVLALAYLMHLRDRR